LKTRSSGAGKFLILGFEFGSLRCFPGICNVFGVSNSATLLLQGFLGVDVAGVQGDKSLRKLLRYVRLPIGGLYGSTGWLDIL
jgi:hypothetical protein